MNGKQQQIVRAAAVLYEIDMVTNKRTELASTFLKAEVPALQERANALNRAHLDERVMYLLSYETRRIR